MNRSTLVDQLPKFSNMPLDGMAERVEGLLAEARRSIDAILASNAPASWSTVVAPLEAIDHEFERIWGPIGHLDAVCYSDDWHDMYESCLDKVTMYFTELGQNEALFARFVALENAPDFERLTLAQKKVIQHALRDFRLSGIGLPKEAQQDYKRITQRLSQLSSQFSSHVLKATQAWSLHLTDQARLAGLPESALGLLAQYAQQKDLPGWRVTLDFPSYHAVMTYADDRSLREALYKAYATRASELSDYPAYDNSALIDEIRQLRHQKALLLGFGSYADYSLATKMVQSPDQVVSFLEDLAQRAKPQAQQELSALADFAKRELGLSSLEPWDVSYVSEKLKEQRFNLSQEALKPYFPVETSLSGMFAIVSALFGIRIERLNDVDVWHPDVRFYVIRNEAGQEIAGFYLDPYARENKRGGAWMDVVQSRWRTASGELRLPVAYLVCNFTPPLAQQQACLTHNEVTTLFHEFGHGLHHMLTEMEQINVSGISGVPWDAVELPSQFMENFCWERESLDLLSKHVESGQPLPDEMLKSLKQTRHFQAAMMLLRQVEFSLFDFLLHLEYDAADPEDVLSLANRVREAVAVLMPPSYHRFSHSFSHIFAGGYAAGYFSYKWAEVLSADAFSLFEETGVLNQDTGRRFRNSILAAGGSVDPMQLFKQFRGRLPSIDPLLRHSGIQAHAS